ncbi:reverse transcriptase domain-containing protein [Tanacetum coccineum]
MGSCVMHDGPRRAVHKAMTAGYFWPSMHRDANNEISSCDSCQVYATVSKLPKNDMISVTSAWPFQKWGMKIVGPLPEASGKIKYLIIVVDYFTKWIETKAVTSITGKQVGEFVLRKNELSKAENTGKLGPKWEGPYEVVETYGTGAYKLRSMEGAEIPRT